MADEPGPPNAADLIAAECLAVRVRTLNRAVSALYDEALRPHGLRVGQFNLLVAVAKLGTARPGDLCRILSMDKSTLSRDVEVMRRNGWLEVGASADARVSPVAGVSRGPCAARSRHSRVEASPGEGGTLIGTDARAALGQVIDRLWKENLSGR